MRWPASDSLIVCGWALAALACALPPLQPQDRQPAESPAVILTAAPVYDSLAALNGGERFPQGAQLMVLRSGPGFSPMQPLVPGFAASADASVSFDGTTILFAGKKATSDPWQIWRIPAQGGAPQRVAAAGTDLIRPLWMPEGRLVYARREPKGFALEAAGLDGSNALRLTWLPGNFVPDDVLHDGRILFESQFPLGAAPVLAARGSMAPAEMFLVYADGSGVESVRCDHPNPAKNNGREHGRQIAVDSAAARAGDIVFTRDGRLAKFTSALAQQAPIVAPSGQYAGDVAESPGGSWLLAVRRPGAKHFAMALWKPGTPLVKMLAQDEQRDLVEPVILAPRAVPNRHPSALHDWTTGNLLALDARQSRSGMLAGVAATVRAETLSEDGRIVSLGTAPVEKDGSFFVQATGDRPLRFILLDAAGQPLRQEQGWFWVRKGEQRICVGCHTGPERAPENRVPLVLLRTTTPEDLTAATQTAATQTGATQTGATRTGATPAQAAQGGR